MHHPHCLVGLVSCHLIECEVVLQRVGHQQDHGGREGLTVVGDEEFIVSLQQGDVRMRVFVCEGLLLCV